MPLSDGVKGCASASRILSSETGRLSGFASVAWAACAGDAGVPGAYDRGGCGAPGAAPKIAVTNRAASRITVWTPRVRFQPLDINLNDVSISTPERASRG